MLRPPALGRAISLLCPLFAQKVRMAFVSSASFTLLTPARAVVFTSFSPFLLRPFTPFLLQLPDPRPPSLLITLLRSQITAKPRQDAVTQRKRDSDRLLPSLKPFGGSWWPAALKATPLAWFQGPSRADPCALRNLTPPSPRALQKNSRLLLCDVPHPQCLPGLPG